MAEIKLTFDLTFTRRFLSRAGAVAIMLCAVPELDSESVTLSTYYPAPSGVYTNMITTGHTYLARDGGVYNAGSNAAGTVLTLGGTPALNGNHNNTKLYVPSGTIGVGQQNDTTPYMRMGMDTGWVQYVANNAYWNGAAYNYVNTGGYGGTASRMAQVSGTISFDTASGGSNPIGWSNRMTIANNGLITVGQSLSTVGAIRSGQGPAGCSAPQQYSYGSPSGGNVSLCGGQYITTVAGFYTKYIALPIDRSALIAPPVNNSFTYMCCNCPTGGCDL
jgi:hypothetical protein